MAVSDPKGLGLGWVGLEKRSGERVGAPGRERMGVDEDEEGEDVEFLGEWRGVCWGESWGS